jgi:hypothetical protein
VKRLAAEARETQPDEALWEARSLGQEVAEMRAKLRALRVTNQRLSYQLRLEKRRASELFSDIATETGIIGAFIQAVKSRCQSIN